MICDRCGVTLSIQSNQCPACGYLLNHTTKKPEEEHSSQTPTDVITQKKPMPLWLKITIGLAVAALVAVSGGILFTESLVDVVDKQLATLRKEKLEQAYNDFTTAEFKKATSLENFKTFIISYPIFTQNKSGHFIQRSLTDNVGILKGHLLSLTNEKIPVEFKVVKENGSWKIMNMRLLSENDAPLPDFMTLLQIAQNQLIAIKAQKIAQSYQEYTSNQFKSKSTQEAFFAFIERHPLLAQHTTTTLKQHTPSPAKITLKLESPNESGEITYHFVFENSRWKIASMQFLPLKG